MRKNNVRTGKQVIKALSIGLSASMMLQPVAAMADELEVKEKVVTDELDNEEVDADEKLAADFENALGEIEEAAKTEGGAAIEAVFTVGTGIITDETKAEIAELAAKEHVEEAMDDISTGNAQVASDLEEMDKDLADQKVADTSANNAFEAINKAAEDISGNLAEIDAPGTSASRANELAAEIEEAAKKAEEEAANLAAAEEASKKAYEAAAADFAKAVQDADAAVEEATKAINESIVDADEAVKKAEDALKKADAYKAVLDGNEFWAKWNLSGAQFNYNNAVNNLNAANARLQKAQWDVFFKTGDAVNTGYALEAANKALETAEKVKEVKDGDVKAKEQAIENLKKAKEEADAAIEKKKADLDAKFKALGISAEEYWKAVDALQQAKKAVDAAYMAAFDAGMNLNGAEEQDKLAKKNLEDVSGNFTGYSDYQKKIMDLEKELKNAETDDEKNAIIENIAVAAMENEFNGKAEKVDGYSIWKVGERYFGYKKTENGIEIYEYSKNDSTEKNVVDSKSGLTKEQIDALGLDENDYKVTNENKGSEALYTVTYYSNGRQKKDNVPESELYKYKNKNRYSATVSKEAVETTYDIDIYATTSEMKESELANLTGEEGVDYKKELVSAAVAAVEGKEATYEVYKEKEVTETKEAKAMKAANTKEFDDAIEDGKAFVVDGKHNYKIGVEYDWYFGEYYYVYYIGSNAIKLGKGQTVKYTVSTTVKDEDTVKIVNESELNKYKRNGYVKGDKKSDAVEAVEGKEAVYKVTQYDINKKDAFELTDDDLDGSENGGYLADYEGKLDSAVKRANAAAEKLETAKQAYNTLKDEHEKKAQTALEAGKTLDEKIKEYNRLESEYKTLNKEYNNLKAQYDAYYEGKTHYEHAWGFVWEVKDPSQYEKDLAAAKKAADDAKKAAENAAREVEKAEQKQKEAEKAHEESLKKLANATLELNMAEWNQKNAATWEKNAKAALTEAKTAEAVAKAAADYAAKVKAKAQGALKEAKEARKALDLLKADITVSPEELKLAKERLNNALTNLQNTQKELEKANNLKEKTQKDLTDAKNKAKRLTDLENSRRGGNDEEEEVIVINEEGAPLTGTITGGRRLAAGPATVVEEEAIEEEVVEIEEEEVAEVEAPVIEEVEIEDEATPEVPEIPAEKKMSWWWILVVLVLGTTGAELYRRHQVKKNAEKVSSDK